MQEAKIIFQELYKDILFIFIKLPKNEMKPKGVFSLLVYNLQDGCSWDCYERLLNEAQAREIISQKKKDIDSYES